MQSWIFSIITPVFSVTRFFRNHTNMLICCSRNISCWKQLCCLIFLWKRWNFFFLMNSTFIRKLFIGNIYYIYISENVKVFTVLFDQVIASLLYKNINFSLSKNKLHLFMFLIFCFWELFVLMHVIKFLQPSSYTIKIKLWSVNLLLHCIFKRFHRP